MTSESSILNQGRQTSITYYNFWRTRARRGINPYLGIKGYHWGPAKTINYKYFKYATLDIRRASNRPPDVVRRLNLSSGVSVEMVSVQYGSQWLDLNHSGMPFAPDDRCIIFIIIPPSCRQSWQFCQLKTYLQNLFETESSIFYFQKINFFQLKSNIVYIKVFPTETIPC